MKLGLVAAGLVVAIAVAAAFIVAPWNNGDLDEQATGDSHTSDTAHNEETHAVDADGPLAGAKCPISMAQVKEKYHCEYRGVTLYFCCAHCAKAFRRSQDKFVADANAQLVATGKAEQLKCPLTGKAVDPATEISVDGVKVAFCCNECREQASSYEGAQRAELIFNDGAFARGFQVVQVANREKTVR